MKLPSSRAYGGWLALARFLTGGIWLDPRRPQVSATARSSCRRVALSAPICRTGSSRRPGRITVFSSTRLSPNAALFAELVRFGEVCVGDLVASRIILACRWLRRNSLASKLSRRSRGAGDASAAGPRSTVV